MLIAAAVLIITGAVVLTFYIREKDLPVPVPASPFQYLDERKAQIYENLRDLQFEFRVGKLSDDDYQKTKLELQSELAKVLAEIDRVKGPAKAAASASPAAPPVSVAVTEFVCPHCQARFDRALKFCGECGKPMEQGDAQ
jgi:predicted amidophosphoribosyltransferase